MKLSPLIALARSAVVASDAIRHRLSASAFASTRDKLRVQLSKHQPQAFVPPPPRMLLGLGIAGCGLQAVKMLRSTN